VDPVSATDNPHHLKHHWCRVHEDEYESELRHLVDEVEWDDVTVVGPDYDGYHSPSTEEPEDNLDDYELEDY